MLQRISSTTSRASLSEASSLSSALALAYRQSHHLYQTHPGRCPPCSSASAPPHPEHLSQRPLPSALPWLWPTDNHITCTKHPGRCPPCSSASAPPHPEHL